MGIRGLTSYIEKNTNTYLTKYELHNVLLVVDGNNLASHIYKWVSKSNSAFGGDYDEYYYHVANFFKSLKKCNVTPIVVIDGGYEERKIQTVLSRLQNKLTNIQNVNSILMSDVKFFPLFMKQAFVDVLDNLGIFHVQCNFEADNEIASIARMLNCPVLSYDSDFYILNVLYIPFSTVHLEPIQANKPDGTYFYMKCCIYNIANFLKHFRGLAVSKLPIIATILGNDYIDHNMFKKFYNSIKITKKHNETLTEKRIIGVLNWLRTETFESALTKILKFSNKKDVEKITLEITKATENYNSISSRVLSVSDKQYEIIYDMESSENQFSSASFAKLLRYSKTAPFMTDMIMLKTYYAVPQVEDVCSISAHEVSMPLICAIYEILHIGIIDIPELTVYTRKKSHISYKRLQIEKSTFLSNYKSYDELINENDKVRLRIFHEILQFDESDINTICSFPDEWKIYIMALIYWSKTVEDLTVPYLCSLIWSLLGLWFVNRNIGLYQSLAKFLHQKAATLHNELKERKSSSVPTAEVTNNNLCSIIESVSEGDCLVITKLFIAMHQVDDKLKNSSKFYYVPTIHKFAQFQSCLYHIFYINALLNFPLKQIRISDFYSGTIVYNMYLNIKNRVNINEYVNELLKCSPNICLMYNSVMLSLSKYFTLKSVKPRKKKKLNKSTKTVFQTEESESSGNEYCDNNNKFALLCNDSV